MTELLNDLKTEQVWRTFTITDWKKLFSGYTEGQRGQIVIPKEAREIFDIKPGDTLILLADKQLGIAIPPKNTFDLLFQRIFGGKKQ
jgi:AbrB family looped-hinge helix DNA binding protein